MPRWDLFAGLAILLAVVTLGLARATQGALGPERGSAGTPSRDTDRKPTGTGRPPAVYRSSDPPVDAWLLFVNVALTHGLLGSLLALGAWYAGIPAAALGLDGGLRAAVLPGVGLGAALYAASEAAVRAADLSGIEHDERLRELLAPGSVRGWAVLFAVVLPLVAVVEELLFRAALIGALSAGYGLPAWGLAVVSSALFGLGHGLQGPAGALAAAVLGFVLAAAFVVTGNLWTVIVAHYLVNGLEFAVHEAADL